MRTQTALTASLIAILAGGAFAQTDINPSVIASIRDSPKDGTPDLLTTDPPFNGLLRETGSAEDRAVLEYDISAFAGMTVTSATIAGRVSVNNSFDNGTRSFDFIIYEANGVAELADFNAAGTTVGSGSYAPPNDSSFTFSFDVAALVQAALDNGATHIGLLVDPTSNPNFPNILDDETILTIAAEPGTSCPADLTGSSDPNDPSYGMPDGDADGDDFFFYLDAFSNSQTAICDLTGSSDPNDPSFGNPDGDCDGDDFFFYLDLFVTGCP